METPLFNIYRSSAGSGKTYRLALDYLKLALQYPEYYRRILAVTFTNKATHEMKARILNNLAALATGTANPDLVQRLQKETSWDVVSLQERSRLVLKSVLHGYSYFSVSTIDSFFQKVITAFARDLEIHGGFTIEFDFEMVTEEILDQIFLDLEDDPQLMEWLIRFIESKIEDNKGWDIRNEVRKLASEMYFDRFHQYFDTFKKDILDKRKLTSLLEKLKKERSVFINQLKVFGSEGVELMAQHDLTVGDLSRINQGPGGLLVKMAAGENLNLNSFVKKAYEEKEAWYTQKSDKKDQILAMLEDGLYDLYKNAIDYFNRHILSQNTYRLVMKLYYNLGLYSNLLEKLRNYRQEQNAILISDLSHLLKIIIGENDAPYIYEKVGNYYQHFLMDEFQDTSVFQWYNFKPLVKNAIAMGKYNMLVGDVKQSIYRWRGGDWQLLHNKVEQDIGEQYINIELLNKNWRSRKNVISFNNVLFQQMPKLIGQYFLDKLDSGEISEDPDLIQTCSSRIADVYDDVIQELPENNQDKKGGIVSLKFFQSRKEEEASIPWNEKVFPELVETIQKIQDQGYFLKDIAILVRTKDEGKKVADYLLEYKNRDPDSLYQYDIISSESLFLYSSPAVNVVISFMKLILKQNDSLARINLYYWLAVLHNIPEVSEPNKIFQDALLFGHPTTLDPEIFRERNFDTYKSLPLVDLLELIIQELDLENFPYEQAYLTGLQNVILDYLNKHNSDLYSFNEWWEVDGKKQSIKPAEEQNAIQILTIHQSKGLQFEMVIIPFCSWNLDHKPNSEVLWCQIDEGILKEFPFYPVKYESALLESGFSAQYLNERSLAYLDNLNILYVAFTRAISGLFVFAELPPKPENIRSIGDVVFNTIDDIQFTEKLPINRIAQIDQWGDEAVVYSSGEIPRSKKTDKISTVLSLKNYEKGSWYHKISIRKQPDLFSMEEWDYHPEDQINYGILLHDILSRIFRKDQADEVLEYEKKSGNIATNQQEIIKNMLLKLWDNKIVDDWFSERWKVKTEVPVLPRSGQISRMDRVMIDGDHVIVVDFKTGIFRAEHKIQVNEYKLILQQMRYKKVEGYLLYLGNGELVTI